MKKTPAKMKKAPAKFNEKLNKAVDEGKIKGNFAKEIKKAGPPMKKESI